ncbi:NUDIX domain-containing protein [Microvirgula curvata]|uniref:DUF4743 domain-containing protein n=1 Tax=Microvirgula aerodenitrificans TaxID=57480 RepID=A0A2S0P9U8_9NEIS|nr:MULTISPECIES: DUF4743 domain-containing protein [Microvirgula]AVY94169.1 DUF4743 domain-containing protein [Microvirgula aerodenitrificans]RAS15569.1 NUDIX domain-containing protein [Microvirgula sp. AG722]
MHIAALLGLLDAASRLDSADLTPLVIAGREIGLLNPDWKAQVVSHAEFQDDGARVVLAPALDRYNDISAVLMRIARGWRDSGRLSGWRGENFTAFAQDGTPLFELERAAFRPLGLISRAVHVNGLVRQADGSLKMWIGRRSPHKSVEPDKLDNLTGGGVAAGESLLAALERESWEEAGMPAAAVRELSSAGRVFAQRRVARGLHREWLHTYDLWLDEGTVPCNQDGEMSEFVLMSPPEVVKAVVDGRFMADAALVALDCLARNRALGASSARIVAALLPIKGSTSPLLA